MVVDIPLARRGDGPSAYRQMAFIDLKPKRTILTILIKKPRFFIITFRTQTPLPPSTDDSPYLRR